MVSNARYYERRAAAERTAAARAITPQAREWHSKLAKDFADRAEASLNVTAACSTAAVSA